jgi:hypothetical protein
MNRARAIFTLQNDQKTRIESSNPKRRKRLRRFGSVYAGHLVIVTWASFHSFIVLRVAALSRFAAYIRFPGWSMDQNCKVTYESSFVDSLVLLPHSLIFPGPLNQSIRATNGARAMVSASFIESF